MRAADPKPGRRSRSIVGNRPAAARFGAPRALKVLLVVVLASGLVGSASNAFGFVEQVINGDFETGDLSGWTVAASIFSDWSVYSGVITPYNGFAIPAPPGGTFAAVAEEDDISSLFLYQDVAIPAGSTATFSAQIYVENLAADYITPGTFSVALPNQQVRVDIVDPSAALDDVGAGVLQNVFITNPGDPLTIPYTPLSANLTPYAGTTVRVRIGITDTEFYLTVGVDDVSIDTVAAVPMMPPWALVTLALVLLLITLLERRTRLSVPR